MSTASILWLICCTLGGWTLGATLVRLRASVWVRHGEKAPPAIKTRMRLASLINAVILLLVSTVIDRVYMAASLSLRGKAVPANMKFYTNLATLLLFLRSKWTGMNERFGFSEPADDADRAMTGSLAAMAAGNVVLSTEFWVGSSHVFQGEHWVRLLQMRRPQAAARHSNAAIEMSDSLNA